MSAWPSRCNAGVAARGEVYWRIALRWVKEAHYHAGEGSQMETRERCALYRQRAAEFERKASTARTEEMRRSWLILARDWKMMALDVELKFLEAPEAKLSPESPDAEEVARLPRMLWPGSPNGTSSLNPSKQRLAICFSIFSSCASVRHLLLLGPDEVAGRLRRAGAAGAEPEAGKPLVDVFALQEFADRRVHPLAPRRAACRRARRRRTSRPWSRRARFR